jgi:hypothetical protein
VIDVGFRSHPRVDGKVNNLAKEFSSQDNSSHGLHVMSIIGASGDNDCPIRGIAQNVSFFTYPQSVSSGTDFKVILEKAEALDENSKNVSILLTYIHTYLVMYLVFMSGLLCTYKCIH